MAFARSFPVGAGAHDGRPDGARPVRQASGVWGTRPTETVPGNPPCVTEEVRAVILPEHGVRYSRTGTISVTHRPGLERIRPKRLPREMDRRARHRFPPPCGRLPIRSGGYGASCVATCPVTGSMGISGTVRTFLDGTLVQERKRIADTVTNGFRVIIHAK